MRRTAATDDLWLMPWESKINNDQSWRNTGRGWEVGQTGSRLERRQWDWCWRCCHCLERLSGAMMDHCNSSFINSTRRAASYSQPYVSPILQLTIIMVGSSVNNVCMVQMLLENIGGLATDFPIAVLGWWRLIYHQTKSTSGKQKQVLQLTWLVRYCP